MGALLSKEPGVGTLLSEEPGVGALLSEPGVGALLSEEAGVGALLPRDDVILGSPPSTYLYKSAVSLKDTDLVGLLRPLPFLLSLDRLEVFSALSGIMSNEPRLL